MVTSALTLITTHGRSGEERSDVGGEDVGDLHGRVVAAAVEVAPVHDVRVVALGERLDRPEVVGEDRDPGARRADLRLVPLPKEVKSSFQASWPTGESERPTATVCGREALIAL